MADLAREANPRRRRQLLQAHPELWRPATVTRFYDEVVRLLHVDIQQAERMARAASLLADRLGDDASRAASLRALGHIYYRKRKYEASVDLYQKSLAIYQRLGDRARSRPHAQQFPAKPDLPGPVPGGHGVRATGAPRSSNGWATACAWRGWTPTWGTSSTGRTVSKRPWNFTSAPTTPSWKSASRRMSPSR